VLFSDRAIQQKQRKTDEARRGSCRADPQAALTGCDIATCHHSSIRDEFHKQQAGSMDGG